MSDRCAVPLAPGAVCDLDAGHPGPHRIEQLIPAEIGQIIEGMLASIETDTAALKRARQRWERANRWLWVAIGANIAVVLANVTVTIGRVLS